MNYAHCYARASGGPRLTGQLRTSPEDFRVEERLGFEPTGAGEHVYLHVRKTCANTEWVAGEIARYAGVRAVDVGYAGRKDRHAVTEQWFSCRLPGRLAPDWSRLRHGGIEVLRSRRHPKKLRTGMHAANRFRILVRGLRSNEPMQAALNDLGDRIGAIGERGFPNYFGEQRFGINGGNLARANEMFQGREFPTRRRGLYISAVRSYLFNRDLSRRVAEGCWSDADDFGWLWGASRTALPVAADPAFEHWCEGLVRLGVKAMRRPLRVVPAALQYVVDGDRLALAFELPPGSFATSLVRELIDYASIGETEGVIGQRA